MPAYVVCFVQSTGSVSLFANPKMIDAKFQTRTILPKPVDGATFWNTMHDKLLHHLLLR